MPIGVGVARVMEFAGLSLAEAVTMASSRPARLIGLEPVELEEGAVADLVLFQLEAGELHVQATILAGQLVYGELPFNSHQTDMTDDND